VSRVTFEAKFMGEGCASSASSASSRSPAVLQGFPGIRKNVILGDTRFSAGFHDPSVRRQFEILIHAGRAPGHHTRNFRQFLIWGPGLTGGSSMNDDLAQVFCGFARPPVCPPVPKRPYVLPHVRQFAASSAKPPVQPSHHHTLKPLARCPPKEPGERPIQRSHPATMKAPMTTFIQQLETVRAKARQEELQRARDEAERKASAKAKAESTPAPRPS
jgi:hypothetical protein